MSPDMRGAWFALCCAIACVGAALVLEALNGPVLHEATFGQNTYGEIVGWGATCLVASVLGFLVLRQQPDNRIAWIFLGGGLAGAVASAGDGLAGYLLMTRPGPTGGGIAARYSSFLAFVMTWVLLGVFLPARFPDGRRLSGRWRVVEGLGVLGAAMWATTMLLPNAFDDEGLLGKVPELSNPLGLEPLASPLNAISNNGVLLLFAGTFGAVASMVVRAIRSSGVQRQQVKIVAYTVGVVTVVQLIVANTLELVRGVPGASLIWDAVGVVATLAIPASLGIAVLRYRLYDIDRLINRTLVYALLSAMLAAGYLCLVFIFGTILRPLTRGSDVTVAVATLVIAALFIPLRRRVQSFIDRRFYRTRYDAARTLESFGARLRTQTDVSALGTEIERVARETMKPAYVGLWLPPRQRPARVLP